MHAWDCLLDDAPEWIEMNAHKRKQANNDKSCGLLLGFAQYHPYDPQYYIFGGMYRVEKILYARVKASPDCRCYPATRGRLDYCTALPARSTVSCSYVRRPGVRQLVFCVGCSFSARMHSTTVSTMSGRVYPTGVSTPISRR